MCLCELCKIFKNTFFTEHLQTTAFVLHKKLHRIFSIGFFLINWSRLLNKFSKKNTDQNKWAYKKQRNLCVKLLKRAKKTFYNTLDVKKVSDNKTFWKTIKPNFTEKTIKDQKITLAEKETVISEESELAEVFINYFENVVNNLNIQRPIFLHEHSDSMANAIKNFEQHPTILKIKENRKVYSS